MTDELSYWARLCTLVADLRCWVRIASRSGRNNIACRWGQLLTIPVAGYLEASGGPVSLDDVAWVEIATKRVVGGIAGRPRQMVEIKHEILSRVREAGLTWDLRRGTWSIEGVFDNEPLEMVRVVNPLGATPAEPLPAV